MNHTPLEYLTKMDEKFKECEEKGLDRYSIEWGKFSHDLNVSLREDIQNTSDRYLRSKLVVLFEYWVELSNCLQFPNRDEDLLKVLRETVLKKEESRSVLT